MASVQYRVVQTIPPQVQTPDFVALGDDQVRVRMMMDGDELVIVAHGADPRACEAILIQLGATEIGVDLCG